MNPKTCEAICGSLGLIRYVELGVGVIMVDDGATERKGKTSE